MRGRAVLNWVAGLIGAAVGGLLGVFAFGWAYRQGFYAMVLPGALLGLGCGLAAGDRSMARGGVCGLAALVLGLYTEWHYRYFVRDPGLDFFLRHLGDLPSLTWISIGAGALVAYWLGRDTLRPSGAGPKGSPTSPAPGREPT